MKTFSRQTKHGHTLQLPGALRREGVRAAQGAGSWSGAVCVAASAAYPGAGPAPSSPDIVRLCLDIKIQNIIFFINHLHGVLNVVKK